MNTVLQFLQEAKTYYLATVEGDQPRVRPFGAVCEYEGKIYFITNNQKKVYQQLKENPKAEFSGMNKGEWIRLSGEAVFDERLEVKAAMLEANPSLKNMYSADDGKIAVFYLKNATAAIESFTGKNETIQL